MISDTNIRRWTVRVICAGILCLAAALLLIPKKEFSENENRYLEKMPKLTAKAVFDGEYTESLGDWLADHFPMRDFFMGLKTGAELAGGRKEINRIYIGEDGYLIEPYAAPQNTQRIIDTFVSFHGKIKERNVAVSLMLVPTAVTVYEQKLPACAPSSDQMKTAREIWEATDMQAVDCSEKLLAASGEQLYYRTDHHWTTMGAYCGYLAYCEKRASHRCPEKPLKPRLSPMNLRVPCIRR